MRQPRRVRRVIHKLDIWSVLKVSVVFYLILLLVLLVAGTVLFVVASATGLRQDIETFIGDMVASNNFHLLGLQMLLGSVLGGIVLVLVGTATNVVLAVLYNLISEVIGGFELSCSKTRRAATRGVRRPRDLRSPGLRPAGVCRAHYEPAPLPAWPAGPEPHREPAYAAPPSEAEVDAWASGSPKGCQRARRERGTRASVARTGPRAGGGRARRERGARACVARTRNQLGADPRRGGRALGAVASTDTGAGVQLPAATHANRNQSRSRRPRPEPTPSPLLHPGGTAIPPTPST